MVEMFRIYVATDLILRSVDLVIVIVNVLHLTLVSPADERDC